MELFKFSLKDLKKTVAPAVNIFIIMAGLINKSRSRHPEGFIGNQVQTQLKNLGFDEGQKIVEDLETFLLLPYIFGN